MRQEGDYPATRKSKVDLVQDSVTLWQKGGTYPPPGTDVLRLPFRFVLPSELPPSCEFKTLYKYGAVVYTVEVVADRPKLFPKRRVVRAIPVLPHNAAGAKVRNKLRSGWKGKARTWHIEKNIRKGIWGEFSRAEMTVSASLSTGLVSRR